MLPVETFSFLKTIPENLAHSVYCNPCYDELVAPELDLYQETMQKAEGVFVFFTTQRNGIPMTRKSKEVFEVRDCIDRDEAILRLAFFAAQAGFNGLIECEVDYEKVRLGAYQTSKWHGTGVAAQVDADKIALQDRQNEVYR